VGATDQRRFVQIEASDKVQRSKITNLGASIEAVRSDSVWAIVDPISLKSLRASGFKILGDFDISVARGGHDGLFDFPPADARFHNASEMIAALRMLEQRHADIVKVSSIGKSVEGRDIWALQINTTPEHLLAGQSSKPGVIFMGNHHAREHVSAEIPLMLAQHLLENRDDTQIAALLDSRDLWIIPMVNPDGVEYDIATANYRMWRKNRAKNRDGTMGVDLNRNYGYKWGTGGSSSSGSSDVYMGPQPFSEPESSAIRDFVTAHQNARVLLSFHTFSELILYPWGHTYDDITDKRDLQVFETMARTMAQWNKYTPQQASDLYIASGDTTDWAYGTHKMFAFTFELSPKDMWSGGFYPGAKILDKVFQDNLRPALYMIEVADDPYKVIGGQPNGWLENYVLPSVPSALGLGAY
jgi:carboxypeptidase T